MLGKQPTTSPRHCPYGCLPRTPILGFPPLRTHSWEEGGGEVCSGQFVALHALPAVGSPTLLVPAFPVRSTSFFPYLKSFVCHV